MTISPAVLAAISARRRSGTTGGGVVGGGDTDPHFASVVSLLHFDGADGSTTFTDVTGKTWTANGNAQIDTVQSKFGGASGLFDGTGDYITADDSADWHFGAGDFTVEFWARFAATGVVYQIMGQSDASATLGSLSWFFQRLATNVVRAVCVSDAAAVAVDLATVTTVSADTWYHVAMQRSVNRFSLFLDGVEEAVTTSAATLNNSGTVLAVGRLGLVTTQTLAGWLDDLRITKGVARYVGSPSNFTPPTAAFPDQ